MFWFGAEEFHVFEACVAEHDRGEGFGGLLSGHQLDGFFKEVLDGIGSVAEGSGKGASGHFFEACC